MISRRKYLKTLGTLGILPFIHGYPLTMQVEKIFKRPIHTSGEMLPVIGVGTWQTFDVGTSNSERNPLSDVLKELVVHGGSMVDSSPMYGRSEEVVGDISTEIQLNSQLFMATKVWTSGKQQGIEQMNTSFRLLKRKKLDLIQVHNLVDWETHLNTLREWKEMGKVRYIGLTHYLDSAHDTLIGIIKSVPVDFIQINYNLMDTHAEQKLLPIAREKNISVIINRPFGEGNLFNRVKGKQLPPEAKEYDCQSWAQFFLKFILSHPSVTCVIPGTSKPHHMIDNLQAGTGKLPDLNQRRKMISLI